MDLISSVVNKVKEVARNMGKKVSDDEGFIRQGQFTPVQAVRDYFNPTYNQGQNFWSTPAAQGLASLQTTLEKSRYEMPKVSLESVTPQIKTPYKPVNLVANLPINLARGIAEGIINAPVNAWQTGARIGYDIVNVPRGEVKLTPQRALSDIAPGLEAYLSVAGLGLGKQAIKEAGKELAKGSVKQAVKKGALEGALYGGGFGLAEAASSKEFAEKQNVGSLVEPTLTGAAGGALIGAAARGVPAAIGALFNKVKSAIREIHPNQPPEWVDEQGRIFVRNELGRFVGLKPLVKEEKIPIKQGEKIIGYITRKRVYPSGKEPRWYGDVREKIGLPREGLTSEDIPLGLSTKPKGGMKAVFEAEKAKPTIPPELEPLAEEARKYKSAEEFESNFLGQTSAVSILKDNLKQGLLPEAKIENGFIKKLSFRKPTFEEAEKIIGRELTFEERLPLSQRFIAEQRYESPSILRKTKSRAKIIEEKIIKEAQNKIKNNPEAFLPEWAKKYDIDSFSLTDFYNQATKGIKEARPEVSAGVEPIPKIEEEKWSRDLVEKVKQQIQKGEKVLPIAVDKNDPKRIVDGNHRYIAYKELGLTPPIVKVDRIKFLQDASKYGESYAFNQATKGISEVNPETAKIKIKGEPMAEGSQIGTVQSLQKIEGKLPKEEPQANISSQSNAYTNIVSNKVKNGEPPTPDEVGKSIEERLNAFTEKVLGYNPQDIQGGQKGASFFTRTLRKGQEAVSTTVEKGLASQFTPVRVASQLLEGFFRGIGMSPERAQASATLRGGINLAQERSFNIGQALYDLLGEDRKSLARINAVLDPELAKTKISFNDLTPKEKQVYNLIREGLDLVHDISYANGFLSPEKYLANKGKYTPRLYEPMELPPEVNEFVKQSSKKLNFDIFKKRKDVDAWKIENSLNNPIYGLAKRLSQVQMNMEVKKYTDFLVSNSRYVSDTPKAGFTKLSESPVYGKLSGKYVLNSAAEDLKGFFFSNELTQKLYDVFRVYDRLPVRQLQKKLLTVFNPTTNVGNIVSDNVFGFLTGVDPLTLNKNILELKKNPQEYRKLVDYLMSKNVVGTDITRTDFVSQLAKVDELANIGAKQKLKGVASKVEKFYGGTDDIYKTAAFKALLDKGYSLEEATRLVADGFQNYSNVGKFYDLWAKTPIIGEPFIKFQGDLIRIIKNAAVNRPLHLITFLATLKGIAYLFSKLSGESEQDRITREQRYAAPYIPGLNIPLTWQTPWGEINVARYMSPTFANRDTSTLMGKMLPFTPETSKYGKDNAAFIAQNISDPLVAPLVQGLVLNRDFRGKPIADVNETKYKPSTLTPEEKFANTATFIARNYTPPPINSAIDVVRAFQGKPNMYGAKQTPAQAMARLFGVKIQKFGPEEAQQQREKDLEFSAQHNEFIDKQINSVYKQLLNKEITQEQADKRIANLEKQKETLFNVPQSGDKIRIIDKDGKLKTIDLLDITPLETDTNYEKALKQKKAFSYVDEILDSNMSVDEKGQALAKLGIDPEDAAYYNIARQDNDIKDIYVRDEIAKYGDNRQEMLLGLIKLRREVNGEMILPDRVITSLYEDGIISYDEAKWLKNAKYTKDGQVKVKLSGRGKSAKLKSITYRAKKLSYKVPKLKAIKVGGVRKGIPGRGRIFKTRKVTFK